MKKAFLTASLTILSFNIWAANIEKKDLDQVCNETSKSELDTYDKIIKKFNKNSVTPLDFQPSEDGLQRFLDEVGIKHFSAKEMTTPNSEEGAQNCGVNELLPPQCAWKNGAAILSILDKIREEIKGPIALRNWWRPSCYNALVGGAKESDHLLSKAFDFDFQSSKERAIAQKIICEELWKKNENIQIGIGCTSLHIGLGSPKGKRFWTYPGLYDGCKVKSIDSCWDL